MNFNNKAVIQSVVRHIIGMVGVWITAKYGMNIDEGTITSVSELVIGLVLSGGAVVAGSIDKTKVKPVDVLVDNPIIEPSIEVKQWFLSSRSKGNMKGLHKDLIELINLALVESPYDFVIISGERTSKEQRALVDAKKSQTMNSKHLKQADGFVHAFDFMALNENGVGTWEPKYYIAITNSMKEIVRRENFNITFGSDWKGFLDYGHVQVGI